MLRLAVLSACLAMAQAGAVVLTDANFDEVVYKSGKSVLVKFYAPWCGHCKRMAPDYEKLGNDYAASSSVVIGDVDATISGDLAAKFGVQGYPTLKYFTPATGEEAQEYNGGRTYEEMKQWVEANIEVKCSVCLLKPPPAICNHF